jgi:TonB family protein
MCQQHRGVDPLTEVGILMRRIWPAIFVSLISLFSVAVSTPGKNLASGALQARERQFTKSVVRAAQFVDVRHISSRPSCGEVQPPEALTTPDPLFTTSAFGHKVKVSFIIGIDGRVHSPLILESGGLAGDRRVLQTVRSWRYRPATCNGVPTETEGKVEFSTR